MSDEIQLDDSPALRARVKSGLRQRMMSLRNALPKSARDKRGREACNRALELPRVRESRLLAAFVAFGAELDPQPIVFAARASGATIVVPRVTGDDGPLAFHVYRPDDALAVGSLGVYEPEATAERRDLGEIDVVLVPALAADEQGNRIGYGRGFYDRSLPLMTNAYSLALLFDFQLVPEVPVMGGDHPVHAIVTDRRVIHVEGGGL